MVKPKKKISLVLLAVAFIFLATSGLILNKKLNQPIDDEDAIRQEFARIRAPVKERLEAKGLKDEIINIQVEGDWAVVDFGGADLETGEPIPAGPGIIVFRKVVGIWIGAPNGSTLWAILVKSAPNTLIPPTLKEIIRIL